MKKIVLIIIIVAVVAIAAAAYFFLVPKEITYYYYPTGEAFVTNVQGTDYLVKMTITLEMTADEADTLTEKSAVLRDCILNILLNTSEEVYRSGDLQVILSNEIVTRLNAIFPAGEDEPPLFTRAYFNDYVMN